MPEVATPVAAPVDLSNLNTLTGAQLLSIRAQLMALDAAEGVRKSAHALGIAQGIVTEFAPAPFSSGAVGVNMNGSGDLTMPDGTVENWTVSVLVRRTASIPPRKAKGHPVTVTKIAPKTDAPDDETADTTP